MKHGDLESLMEMMPKGQQWQPLRAFVAELDPHPYEACPVLLHGDFWPQNLIWQNGKIAAILDWEDAAFGDPLSDIACAILELRYLFCEDLVQVFINAYRHHCPIDDKRLALWHIYVAAAAQFHMANWGLEPAKEAHMRAIAHHQIRQAGALLQSCPH